MSTDTAAALLADALAGVPGFAELDALEDAAARAEHVEQRLELAAVLETRLAELVELIERLPATDEAALLAALVHRASAVAARVRDAQQLEHFAAAARERRARTRLDRVASRPDPAIVKPAGRRCTETRLDGSACQAYALPWSPRPLCWQHSTGEERAHNAERRAAWQAQQGAR